MMPWPSVIVALYSTAIPIFLLAASHTLITINVSDLYSSHGNNADDITVQAMVTRYAVNDGKQVKRSYDAM